MFFENYLKDLKKKLFKIMKNHSNKLLNTTKNLYNITNQYLWNLKKKKITKKLHINGPSEFEQLNFPHFVLKNNIQINIKSTSDNLIGFTYECLRFLIYFVVILPKKNIFF